MPGSKKGEKGMTGDELEDLIKRFKDFTTAPNFTIIIFCSLQQLGPFDTALRNVLNICPELGVWHREEALSTNLYSNGFTSAAEGVIFGFHQAVGSANGKGATKSEWQRPRRAVHNVFHHRGVIAQSSVSCILYCNFRDRTADCDRLFLALFIHLWRGLTCRFLFINIHRIIQYLSLVIQ